MAVLLNLDHLGHQVFLASLAPRTGTRRRVRARLPACIISVKHLQGDRIMRTRSRPRRLPWSASTRARLAGGLLVIATGVMIAGWIARLDLAGRELLIAGTGLAVAAFLLSRTPSTLLYLVLAVAIGWFPVLIFRPVESLLAVGIGVGISVWWQRQQGDDDSH